jgi:hypothetical protein
LLLVGLASCSPSRRAVELDWTPVAAPDLGAVVARVGAVPIFGSQVVAHAKAIGKAPREALSDLVSLYLLAERARRDGRWPADITDVEVKSAAVQRLLERELEPMLRPEAIPDSVLRPLYDRIKDAFVHPRLVEVGVLAIYTGALMKTEPRNERAAVAKELYAHLQQHPPGSLDAFAAIARDPAWAARNVVYSRFLQAPDRPLSPSVGTEIAKLKAEGETTQLLTDQDGFYLARYIGERPPENITFEQARPKLLEGYLEHWRQQQFQDYTGKLLQAHRVVAFFDRLNEQRP